MAIFDKTILYEKEYDVDTKEFVFSYEDMEPVLVAFENYDGDYNYEFSEQELKRSLKSEVWATLHYDKDEVKNKIISSYTEGVELSREDALKLIVSAPFEIWGGYYELIERTFGHVTSINVDEYARQCKIKYNINDFIEFCNRIISFLESEIIEYPSKKEELSKYIEIIRETLTEEKQKECVDSIIAECEEINYHQNEEVISELSKTDFEEEEISKYIISKKFNYTLEEVYSMIPDETLVNGPYFYGPESEAFIDFTNKLKNIANKYCVKDDGTKYEDEEIIKFVINKYNASINWTAIEEFSQGLYDSEYDEYIDYSKLIK